MTYDYIQNGHDPSTGHITLLFQKHSRRNRAVQTETCPCGEASNSLNLLDLACELQKDSNEAKECTGASWIIPGLHSSFCQCIFFNVLAAHNGSL